MHAHTVIEVGLDGRGRSVASRLRCEVPLLVRVADEPGATLELLLVNGAAGPLGGDRLRLSLTVGDGAAVRVRSVAAAMAQPGPHGDHSSLEVDVSVGEGASLDWAPLPTVSVRGSDHRTRLRLCAAATSTVTFTESVSLGRHGEPSGRLALRQRVQVGGDVVLDHESVLGDGALAGPGANGPWRSISSTLVLGDPLATLVEITDDRVYGVFALSPRCSLVSIATNP